MNNNKIYEFILDGLNSLTDHADSVQGCDLHNELFNGDGLIYTADCLQATEDLGVWDCINLVVGYEKAEFGEVYSKIDPYKIANMVLYIMGQELLNFSPTLQDCWDSYLSEDDLKAVRREIFAALKEQYKGNTIYDRFNALFVNLCDTYDK